MIVRLRYSRTVIPKGPGGKKGLILWKVDLDPPFAARQQVQRTYHAADTAVIVLIRYIIHRRRAAGRMPDDTIVCFQSPAGPWSPHGDIPELYRSVII